MQTFTIFASALAFAGFSIAQTQYNIDPSTVSASDRAFWCQSQKTQCPLICTQFAADDSAVTLQNKCDTETLQYSCVCGDGQSPDLAQYSLTIPFYECQTYGNQCVKACGLADNACSDKCRSENPCGAQEPTKPSSSSVAPKSTSAPSATDSENKPAETTAPANMALDGGSVNAGNNNKGGDKGAASSFGAAQGLVIVAGCFAAGFALVL